MSEEMQSDSKSQSVQTPASVPIDSNSTALLGTLLKQSWDRTQALEEAIANRSEPDEDESVQKPSDLSEDEIAVMPVVRELASERGVTVSELWTQLLEASEKLKEHERTTLIDKVSQHYGWKSKLVGKLLSGVEVAPELVKITREGRKFDAYMVESGEDKVPVDEFLSDYLEDIRVSGPGTARSSAADRVRQAASPNPRAALPPTPGLSGGVDERVREQILRSGRYFRF